MIELTKADFEEKVLQGDGMVVVDFYGDGCGPCEALKPHYHQAAEQYAQYYTFTALNTSKARRVAIGQKVMGLPVIALYKGGEKIHELVKEDATPESIVAMLEQYKG